MSSPPSKLTDNLLTLGRGKGAAAPSASLPGETPQRPDMPLQRVPEQREARIGITFRVKHSVNERLDQYCFIHRVSKQSIIDKLLDEFVAGF